MEKVKNKYFAKFVPHGDLLPFKDDGRKWGNNELALNSDGHWFIILSQYKVKAELWIMTTNIKVGDEVTFIKADGEWETYTVKSENEIDVLIKYEWVKLIKKLDEFKHHERTYTNITEFE